MTQAAVVDEQTQVDAVATPALRRAREDWQKEERSQSILDAAERLFVSENETLPTVEQVARASGVAKGTVYLYFKTKEQIFLTIFHNKLLAWGQDIRARIEAHAGPITAEVIADAMIAYPLEDKTILNLAGFSASWLESDLKFDDAVASRRDLSQGLQAIGAAIEARRPGHSAIRYGQMLLQSYSYLVGLWQVASPPNVLSSAQALPEFSVFHLDYPEAARKGVVALLTSQLG